MGLACPLISGTGSVAVDHLPRSPAGQAHQVTLVAASGEPGVGKRVPELVRVDVTDARLLSSIADGLVDAVVGHRTGATEPQFRPISIFMACAGSEIAVQR